MTNKIDLNHQLANYGIPEPRDGVENKLAEIALNFFQGQFSVARNLITELDESTRNKLHEYYWRVSKRPDIPYFGQRIQNEAYQDPEFMGKAAKWTLLSHNPFSEEISTIFSRENFLQHLSPQSIGRLKCCCSLLNERLNEHYVWVDDQVKAQINLYRFSLMPLTLQECKPYLERLDQQTVELLLVMRDSDPHYKHFLARHNYNF